MSRYWPRAPYAEDQPYPHAILAAHVAVRGLTTGAALGTTATLARHVLSSRPAGGGSLARRVVLAAGTWSLWAAPLSLAAMAGRMRGRDLVEWQDRSWRLLGSEGQVETDDWTAAGAAAGAAAWAAGAARGGGRRMLGLLGASSVGGLVGVLGYLGWRYGVNGGKFPGDEKPAEAAAP